MNFFEAVEKEMSGLDGSHDFLHIQRVYNLATRLAQMEENVDMELVKLGALLHDIADWKYSGSETAGSEKARAWLLSQNYDASRTQQVVDIIDGIGFKNELGLTKEEAIALAAKNPSLAVVQDADRLDAIGAIGIARAFTFGGSKNRPLHDPHATENENTQLMTKDGYMKRSNNGATLQHFYEKLFHLKGMMKTNAGRQIAEERHQYMQTFVGQFLAEWEGLR